MKMQNKTKDDLATEVFDKFKIASETKSEWRQTWEDCYNYSLPLRKTAIESPLSIGVTKKQPDDLYDATAADAVEQLAASIISELAPSWSEWFSLVPGAGYEHLAPELSDATKRLHIALANSNFPVEFHQAVLDLICCGTGCLMIEEAKSNSLADIKFQALSLGNIALEEGTEGRINTLYRLHELSSKEIDEKFDTKLGAVYSRSKEKLQVIESFSPLKNNEDAFEHLVILGGHKPQILKKGVFNRMPFVAFRWLKAPQEVYGRSPVMKALPDIKTLNKLVELTLKNASLAVGGLWQLEDDGIVNPANIEIKPGAIIPRASGSSGLTPVQHAGKFDISYALIESLRKQIRRALYVDFLGVSAAPKMTATEVLERSSEITRLLGATYGRLQSELFVPLVRRLINILSRRGAISPIDIDAKKVILRFDAPLADYRRGAKAAQAARLFSTLKDLVPQTASQLDSPEILSWFAERYELPADLIAVIKKMTNNDPDPNLNSNLNPNPNLNSNLNLNLNPNINKEKQ